MKHKIILLVIIVLAFILRIYRLDQVPPSLYWDEASLGYNAFSISQTLRDEHGVFLPVTNFAAFGDYKPVGYIYAIVPFVKVFGLSEWAVRFPSALAGTLLVLVAYFLIEKKKIALLAALFVAVSPWSLQMSRAGFEANLATLFSGLGVLFFLKKSFPLSAIFFALAMYTFNTHRIFVPMLVVGLSILYFQKKLVIFYLVLFILLLPLIPHLLSPEGKLRFNEVSWVNNLSIIQKSNKQIEANGNVWWAKIIYNRRVYFVGEFSKHYLDHLRPDFLFESGDVNPRLSVRTTGIMYWLDLPLLILGLIFLIKKRTKLSAVLIFWLLIAPIPAAFARETPHALRILNILPVPQIISAMGLYYLVQKQKKLVIILAVILSVSVYLYLKSYYVDYPKKYDMDWQYGYKQAVEYVSGIQDNYEKVNVTGFYGRPYIYFLFYNKYSPEKYWANRSAYRDQFGFWVVNSFDKYNFADNLPAKMGKTLYVDKPDTNLSGKKLLKTIYDLNNQPVFLISEGI